MAFRRGPIRRTRRGYLVDLSDDERAVLGRMVDELGELLRSGEAPQRLFPTAYTDDPERDAEYRRLMHDELLTSRLAAIDAVREILTGDGNIDESQLLSLMHAINALRLVLGDLLDVSEDPVREVAVDLDDSAEHHLYQYLSWLLEWCVRAQSR
jgi:hypothetical protein